MIINNPLEHYNFVPGIQPVDTAATAISTQYIDLKAAKEVAFLVQFGTVTVTSADQPITITVNAATVQAGTSASAIAFTYRLSGAVAANTWAAPAAATSAGYAPVGGTISGLSVLVYVDPAAVAAAKTDGRWVNLTVTPDAGATACNVSVIGLVDSRYKQVTHISTT